jgi:hypothetical protein
MSANEYERCEELRAAIKVLFDHLTYDEQEEVIAIIKRNRLNNDR